MPTLLVFALIISGALVSQATPPPTDVRRLTFSSPRVVRTVDASALRGIPTRLCPSADGSSMYLRTTEVDRWANEKVHHQIVPVRGNEIVPMETEPAWASGYWAWKSSPDAPGRPGFHITLETRNELLRTTNVPREGNIGQHTADPSETLDEVVRRATLANQKVKIETLWLHGRAIATAINRRVVPGVTFGWAPAPLALIAYANEKGRLVVMDEAGRTCEVPGARDVLLPAWSEDGRTLFFLRRAGKRFELRAVEVK